MTKTLQRDTRAGLARRWGWHKTRVTRLFQAEGAPRFTDGQIEVEEAEAWRDRRLAARAAGGVWRRELDRLRCSLLEIELAERAAGLVDRETVQRIAREDAAAINGSLRAMPDALAGAIVGAVDVEAVRAVLSRWARATLQGWRDSLREGGANEVRAALRRRGLLPG
jgi:hypothetical protein